MMRGHMDSCKENGRKIHNSARNDNSNFQE